ncbi:uncharacterized protein PITG_22761 [Phytophthora infestans T30-4]|uniref:Uncharacterized protein n=1 Tax=Phytophthora infestans (strain T30-4) TaxID=403677 RepID=D0N3W4_PHYIT|nr:uncharacterized protein PITG_22761 [Phytophthora infestans T30-4]EEY69068.1 conserved hypothetical protein [Phytophthora infestans T30-4]|eukprot:XP_002998922.1 conserved hypothetical protein [Phytophthora infestans T30-4]
MRFRLQCLLLALYPPTDNAADRRKLKASALQARLQLLSAFFEEMSYYGMLAAFEDTVHDNLMWFGGRAAKHASGANDDSKSRAQEDLGALFKRHRRRYDQVITNALDPFDVDNSGYRSIPELLETSQAINPTRPKNLRLSDKARARIALDVSGSNPPKGSWVGNRSSLRPFSPCDSSRSRHAADCQQTRESAQRSTVPGVRTRGRRFRLRRKRSVHRPETVPARQVSAFKFSHQASSVLLGTLIRRRGPGSRREPPRQRPRRRRRQGKGPRRHQLRRRRPR